jgi:hypothetical protein
VVADAWWQHGGSRDCDGDDDKNRGGIDKNLRKIICPKINLKYGN